MRRRDLLAMLGGVAVIWPLAARAQQAAMPVMGLLSAGVREERRVAALHQGLGEAGYVNGKDVVIEFRWAEGHFDRLPALAADLVSRHVAVMVGPAASKQRCSRKRPRQRFDVFVAGGDPVKSGIVESLGRPAATSRVLLSSPADLNAKRMELLPRCRRKPP